MTETKLWTAEEQAEHRAALVAALRSGDYKQGQNMLRTNDDCFCCLGVACDIAKEALGASWKTSPGNYSILGHAHDLPKSVMEYFGFANKSGVFHAAQKRHGSYYRSLVGFNDMGVSFAEIAEFIETQADQLIKEPL